MEKEVCQALPKPTFTKTGVDHNTIDYKDKTEERNSGKLSKRNSSDSHVASSSVC
jgi:hypothetical protein